MKPGRQPAAMPLALAVLLSACGSSQQSGAGTDTASESAIAPASGTAGGETNADVAVVEVPRAAPATTGTDAAVLTAASTIASTIVQDKDIVRVRTDDGWAWKRGNDVIRTASLDGRRVAYYRQGEDHPFFMQEGADSYAYQGGRPVRRFDDTGRASPPSAVENRSAQQLADAAVVEHRKGEQARGVPSPRPSPVEPSPPIEPSFAADHGPARHDAGPGQNREQPRPRPSEGAGQQHGHGESPAPSGAPRERHAP